MDPMPPDAAEIARRAQVEARVRRDDIQGGLETTELFRELQKGQEVTLTSCEDGISTGRRYRAKITSVGRDSASGTVLVGTTPKAATFIKSSDGRIIVIVK